MMQPSGVQGASAARPPASRPALLGRRPSTSLAGSIGVDDDLGLQRFRQRQLHQNAVHRGIAIELRDQPQQIALRNIGRQPVLKRIHAGGLRLRMLAADIDFAGRIVANEHHREPRNKVMLALDPSRLGGHAGAKLGGNGSSIDGRRCHGRAP
jgi:hypothetical protein